MHSTDGFRVLVADDNRTAAFMLGKALSIRGHAVEIVLNGLAAVDVARQFKPQVILLDIGMPGIDGYEVTSRIRSDPAFEKTLIIVVSGHGRDEDIDRSLSAGADHHLVKPLDFETLWAILNDASRTMQPDTAG